jgi:hypothetical protein
MEASDYIAMAAGLIAIASFFVAIRQNQLQRIHNKLSVKPLLTLYRKEFINVPVEITLHNKGLGPAIIVCFELWVDDKKVTAKSDNIILDAITELGLPTKPGFIKGHLLPIDEVVNVGDEILLVSFNETAGDTNIYNQVMKQLPRLKFSIKYKSAYEDYFEIYGNG